VSCAACPTYRLATIEEGPRRAGQMPVVGSPDVNLFTRVVGPPVPGRPLPSLGWLVGVLYYQGRFRVAGAIQDPSQVIQLGRLRSTVCWRLTGKYCVERGTP